MVWNKQRASLPLMHMIKAYFASYVAIRKHARNIAGEELSGSVAVGKTSLWLEENSVACYIAFVHYGIFWYIYLASFVGLCEEAPWFRQLGVRILQDLPCLPNLVATHRGICLRITVT